MKYTEFWKSTLNNKEKACYEAVLAACKKGETTVSVPTVPMERISMVMECLSLDRPELFYLSRFYQITSSSKGIEIGISFTESWEEARKKSLAVAEILRKECGKAKNLPSDYAKELFVFDYLSSHVSYRKDTPECFTVIGPFLNGAGACEGIAKSAALMLMALGLRCLVVAGTSEMRKGEKEGHAWNIVYIDGTPYHVDFTAGLDGLHGYVNVTDAFIRRTHSFNPIPGIRCIASNANYYVMNGTCFRNVSEAKKALPSLFRKQKAVEIQIQDGTGADHAQSLTDAAGSLRSSIFRFGYIETMTDLNTQTYYIRRRIA